MKIVIHPAIEPDRLSAVQRAAPGASWVNASTVEGTKRWEDYVLGDHLRSPLGVFLNLPTAAERL